MTDLADFLTARITEDEAEIAAGWDFATLDSSGWMGHAATWGRERALAECDAKRQIVALAVASDHGFERPRPWGFDVLEQLALPYADHPDYDEEWRP